MIIGVILAAGESKRMGSPKPFLKWGDSTFIETIVERLKEAGIGGIVAVVRPEAEEQAGSLLKPEGVTVVVNADADRLGPISSIRAALSVINEESWGILVCPVDHPAVERSTYAALLQEARDNPGQMIVPVCQGRRGHPTLFPAEVFDDLHNLPAGKGADAVLDEQSHRLVEMDVSDTGILRDLNTPDDYESAKAAQPKE